MKAAPRRKVVSSHKSNMGMNAHNYFTCVLSCGHEATAYGRMPPGGYVHEAPKSCECRKCLKAAPAPKETGPQRIGFGPAFYPLGGDK